MVLRTTLVYPVSEGTVLPGNQVLTQSKAPTSVRAKQQRKITINGRKIISYGGTF